MVSADNLQEWQEYKQQKMMKETGWSTKDPQDALIRLAAENESLKKDLEKAKNKVKAYKVSLLSYVSHLLRKAR